MKYIKNFTDAHSLIMYKKTNFVTPHVYFNNSAKTFDYMKKYIPLEYISSTSTGGQYIDLGCKLFENTDDIRIDIKFNMKGGGKDYNIASGVNGHKPSVLIGSISELDPYFGFVVRKADIGSSGTYNDNYITMYTKWQISNSVYKNANGDANNKQKYYPTYFAGNISGYEQTTLNQIYEKTFIIDNLDTIESTKFNQMKNLETYMFAIYKDGGTVCTDYNNKMWRFSESDVYYCKITKGNQVVRNLIPVKKPSTNEIGLYDMENDYFYVSQGDDPFVAGPKL